jgi:ribonuclease P/MRP protein subunit RPP40
MRLILIKNSLLSASSQCSNSWGWGVGPLVNYWLYTRRGPDTFNIRTILVFLGSLGPIKPPEFFRITNDVIYIDSAKAFDSIVSSKLLVKLEMYGISGKLLEWIRCFLTNRTQYVTIDHCFSAACAVISGVPQGSVLGPLLFLVYINDIESVCCGSSTLQLFAGDAKLYSEIDINYGSLTLQLSLDRLADWADTWQLTININKCAILSLSRKAQPILYAYCINGSAIPRQNCYVDLGVTVSSNLSFEQHINSILSKARQRTSIIFRGFISRKLITMRAAFTTYIRPLLEYNSIIWNPIYINLIDLIENVQRQFTKGVSSISSLSYSERLALLDLDLLELRGLRFDLIYYYKVFNRLTPFNPNEVFNIYSPPQSSRSESSYLLKPIHATNCLMSSLFLRSVAAWNALPATLRSSSSLSAFKRELKRVDLTRFLSGSAARRTI